MVVCGSDFVMEVVVFCGTALFCFLTLLNSLQFISLHIITLDFDKIEILF
jgi:hypothetical protein